MAEAEQDDDDADADAYTKAKVTAFSGKSNATTTQKPKSIQNGKKIESSPCDANCFAHLQSLSFALLHIGWKFYVEKAENFDISYASE